MTNSNLRKGMWVRHGDKIGIANSIDNGLGTAEVHYTDAKGVTAETALAVPQEELSQAAFNDIPKARRPEAVPAKQLGYL